MEVRRREGHIRDHRNKRTEETNSRRRIVEASSEEGRGSKWAAPPYMEWNGNCVRYLLEITVKQVYMIGAHGTRIKGSGT